jgi:hypothetical protein
MELIQNPRWPTANIFKKQILNTSSQIYSMFKEQTCLTFAFALDSSNMNRFFCEAATENSNLEQAADTNEINDQTNLLGFIHFMFCGN